MTVHTPFRPALLFTSVIAASILSLSGSATAQGTGIAGNWRTDDNSAIISIAPCGPALCGRISRFLVAEPAGGVRDTNNPDRALRSRPLIGVAILTGLRNSAGSWSGRGYSPQEGRNFNATVTPLSGGRLRLRGCVAVFCRTVVWTRAS